MLLKEIADAGLAAFGENADNWRDAVTASCRLLCKAGITEEGYAGCIIQCVEKYGPYIAILPGIAIPHCNEGNIYAKKTAIAFTRFSKPITFDGADSSKDSLVFFTLVAADKESHLENMKKLFQVLSDDDTVEKLLHVEDEEQLRRLDAQLK